jgi:DNA modification methylase
MTTSPFYSQNDINVYNDNCLDYLKTLADNSIKFTLTSPPYDDIRDYNGYSFSDQSVDQLAQAMHRLSSQSHDQLLQMGQRSAQLAAAVSPKIASASLMSVIKDSTHE